MEQAASITAALNLLKTSKKKKKKNTTKRKLVPAPGIEVPVESGESREAAQGSLKKKKKKRKVTKIAAGNIAKKINALGDEGSTTVVTTSVRKSAKQNVAGTKTSTKKKKKLTTSSTPSTPTSPMTSKQAVAAAAITKLEAWCADEPEVERWARGIALDQRLGPRQGGRGGGPLVVVEKALPAGERMCVDCVYV